MAISISTPSSTPTPSTKLTKLTILIKKSPSLSHKAFHHYWRVEHPKIWLSVPIVRSNILKYSQFHINNVLSAPLKEAGIPIAEYDGGVEMWGSSLESLMAVFHDAEYLEKVVPDEEKFLLRSEAVMMVGWEEEVWRDGKEVVVGKEV